MTAIRPLTRPDASTARECAMSERFWGYTALATVAVQVGILAWIVLAYGVVYRP